jgi:hypothetical protein
MGQYRWVFFWWIAPALLFFIFGHLGSIGYLLFFQPAVVLWLTQRVFEGQGRGNVLKIGYFCGAGFVLGLFLLGRPFHAEGGWRRTVDILAMVNTAASVREEYSVSRNSVPGPIHPGFAAMTDAGSDEEFLEAAERAGYTPIPRVGSGSE